MTERNSTARESIENLWDRAIPVGPLLDAYRAEVLAAAGVAPAADQTEPDLLEEYLRHLRGQGTEPDLSDLPPDRCALIAGQFEIVKALADRDPNLPPIEEDPVARRLGLHQAAAGQRIADAMLAVLPDQRAALERAADIAEEVALKRHRQHETEREQGALDVMTELRRMAAGAQQQEPTPVAARESRANESAGSVAGAQQQTDTETRSAPEATAWRGATELAPDRVITALATTGLVGYRQNSGRLLHCLAHKPAPASRYADFHEVTADDLDNGGTCVHPDCGRDLLTPWPTAPVTQQPAAEPRTTWTPGPVAVAQAAAWARQQQAATVDPAMCPRCKGDNSEAFELCGTCAEQQTTAHDRNGQ